MKNILELVNTKLVVPKILIRVGQRISKNIYNAKLAREALMKQATFLEQGLVLDDFLQIFIENITNFYILSI